MFGILNFIADIALDYAAVKSIQLNRQEEPRNSEEWKKRREERKLISDIRNGVYVVRRLIR